MERQKKPSTLVIVFPWLILIAGIIGVISAGILTNEYISLLKNPHYRPVCNLNPIFSCSSVTTSNQAHAFGIPNEFLGLAGYAIVATVGGVLLAGAKIKRWFWLAFNGGLLLAIAFLSWLQFETIYRIGALCLFCMIVWAVSIPAFWYTTIYNLDVGHFPASKRLAQLAVFVRRHHLDILIVWYLIIIALILKRFWYYFGNL